MRARSVIAVLIAFTATACAPRVTPSGGVPHATPFGISLLVASSNTYSVVKYNGRTGAFIGALALGQISNAAPVGLTFGPDGNLYVLGESGSVVRFHGRTGVFLGDFVPAGYMRMRPWARARCLVFGPDKNLYVSSVAVDDHGTIFRYDGGTGALLGTFASGGELRDPMSMAFGPDGNLYVANAVDPVRAPHPNPSDLGPNSADAILRFNGSGTFMGVFASGGRLRSPWGMAFGPDGRLYVSSWSTHTVLRYDGKSGAFIGVIARGNIDPQALTFGPDGHLYVTDTRSKSVLRFDGKSGRFIDTFIPSGTGDGLGGPMTSLVFSPQGAFSFPPGRRVQLTRRQYRPGASDVLVQGVIENNDPRPTLDAHVTAEVYDRSHILVGRGEQSFSSLTPDSTTKFSVTVRIRGGNPTFLKMTFRDQDRPPISKEWDIGP